MSDRALRAAVALVALAGVAVAGYLTYVHYQPDALICTSGGGCETVQDSSYAELAGIPVALLGLLGYVAILGSLVKDTETTRSATALLAIGGLGFSLWLTYVEIWELEAICIWCVGSAICMTLLAGLATTRLLRAPAH